MRSGRVDGVPLQAIEAARGLGDGVPVTSPPPPRRRSDASLQFFPVVINHVFLYQITPSARAAMPHDRKHTHKKLTAASATE